MGHSYDFTALEGANLVSGAIYRGGSAGNVSDDPISRLLPVGNAGGIRYRGPRHSPSIVVLLATRQEPEWPDYYDPETRLLTYFGDNKAAGVDVLDTPRGGNRVLQAIFQREATEETLPLILAFEASGVGRDRLLLGTIRPVRGGLTVEARPHANREIANYRAMFLVDDATEIGREQLEAQFR